jgi:uncharacterized membrane protein YgcG
VPRGERGVLLLGLMTMLVVMSILAGMAVQEWSVVEQREREADLIFIQEQFAAGILAYQQDQGAAPAELEQLTRKGQKGQVFLRKKWTDPMIRGSKFEDWCLLKVGAAGRVVSSCSSEGGGEAGAENQPGELGLGAGSEFRAGQQETTANPRRQPQGVAPGGIGIVGVHSKSGKKAFNTVKRGEDTYNKWEYTIEDYRKEIGARMIPGLPTGQGPGGGQGQQQPGQSRPGGGFSGGSGGTGGSSSGTTGGTRGTRR